MRISSKSRAVVGALSAVLLMIGLASCAGSGDAAQQANQGETSTQQNPPASNDAANTPSSTPGSNGGASNDNRSGAKLLVESLLSAFDAQVSWDSDTLVLTMEGDANDELESKMVCSMVNEVTKNAYDVVVEFPNGTFDCTN